MWDYPRPPAVVPNSRHVVVRYGGWVTTEIIGPFKDQAGTSGW
ncbi:MAG: hypothetical protein WD601_03450 [Pseudohongiellaceae bacterium]